MLLYSGIIFPSIGRRKDFVRYFHPYSLMNSIGYSHQNLVRNLLAYVFPTTLMVAATILLSLKALREQGRLGRFFGKVIIRDQPPSNTVQKIIALKKAMRDMEKFLQNINVTLLKLRTIVLSGQPQVCDVHLNCL